MANYFNVAKRVQLNHPMTYEVVGGLNPTHSVICSCTGPSTSVKAGMIADVSDWLPNACYGARVLGRLGGSLYDVDLEVKPASSFTSAQTKLVAIRRSIGDTLSSAVDLSGQKWLVEFIGN